jgi:probable rRNA maturation factor
MIEIINRQHKHRINQKKFKNLLNRLIEHHKLEDPEISLVFVGTKAIKTLNRRFLKKDAPTDILSFPIGEKSSDGKYYLGDIIISVPQAFKQSRQFNYSLESELKILVIHGFLHLMGFKHGEGIEEEESKMKTLFLKEN